MKTENIRRFKAGTRSGAAARWLLGLVALALAPASLLAQSSIKVDWVAGGATNAAGIYNHVYNGSSSGNFALQTQFDGPGGMAFDPAGRLYVVDANNRAVRRLDFTTNKSSVFYQFTNPVAPVDVAVDAGTNVFVLSSGDNLIRKLNKSGGFVSNVTAAGVLTNVAAMTMYKDDSRTNFYVVELGGAVKKVSLPGGVVTTVTVVAGMTTPGGIVAMDDGNRLIISDAGNHVVRVVDANTGVNGIYAGQLGVSGTNDGLGTAAQFNSPRQITKAGDNILIIADYGNNQVRKIDASTNVSLLYGSLPWFTLTSYGLRDEDYGVYPGFRDGAAGPEGVAESRQPYGVIVDGDGNVYVSERYYHVIRKVTGTGLSGPTGSSTGGGTVLPAVKAPTIGLAVRDLVSGTYNFIPITNSSSLSPVTFYTNALVVILPGETNVSTIYTVGGSTNSASGATAPTPSESVGLPVPDFQAGQIPEPIPVISARDINPFVIVRAISLQTGRSSSSVVSAVFNFKTPPPVIVASNNNAASFFLTDSATNAAIYYSTDGSDPTNGGPFLFSSTAPNLSFNVEETNLLFKARAFAPNYEGSIVVSNLFTTNSFVPNKISYGFASGEGSSDFLAAAGQTFYAPVTLTVLPSQKMYAMQFNMTLTNTPTAAALSRFTFISLLKQPLNGVLASIPPLIFMDTTAVVITNVVGVGPGSTTNVITNIIGVYTNSTFRDISRGFIGVGWYESQLPKFVSNIPTNLYDVASQDLISYSSVHDTAFSSSAGKVLVGTLTMTIPSNGVPNQTNAYVIKIGRPSASADIFGSFDDSDVYIATPTNVANPLRAVKSLAIGNPGYVVGDVTPFRWLNAGDFGDTNSPSILANDVLQVFRSAVYSWNTPPVESYTNVANRFVAVNPSDFYDAMDASDGINRLDLLYSDGSSTAINGVVKGDGSLNVDDVFVTFRRSLDPTLFWIKRYWTNGYRTNTTVPNTFRGQAGANQPARTLASTSASITPPPGGNPSVTYVAGDVQGGPGQTIQVPITAQISGSLPIRVLMLGLTVEPLDGAPPLVQTVQFIQAPGLGTPLISESINPNSYAAAWLNTTNAGISGTNLIGTLTITIPANASTNAAYVVRFGHVSGSPNGLGIFPSQIRHGLLTLRDRSGSSLGDNIPDSWRLRYFGTISNFLSVASADADGDGVPNWAEYRAGTSPVDSASNLRMLSAQALTSGAAPPSGMTLTVPTVDGKNYLLEYCSSLFGTNWSTVTNFTGTGLNVQLQDGSNATGEPRFYRVRLQE